MEAYETPTLIAHFCEGFPDKNYEKLLVTKN